MADEPRPSSADVISRVLDDCSAALDAGREDMIPTVRSSLAGVDRALLERMQLASYDIPRGVRRGSRTPTTSQAVIMELRLDLAWAASE